MLEHWSAAHIEALPRDRPAGAVVDNIRTLFAISTEIPRRPALPQHLIATALAVTGH
jgi:hypothetical protein